MSAHRKPIPRHLHLVRDVQDKLLADRAGERVGRVDRIALHLHGDDPPRVVRIETGSGALAERLNFRLSRAIHALRRRFGLRGGRPVKFPWSKLQSIGTELHLDIDKNRSAASRWERWLRKHITERIPGMKKP